MLGMSRKTDIWLRNVPARHVKRLGLLHDATEPVRWYRRNRDCESLRTVRSIVHTAIDHNDRRSRECCRHAQLWTDTAHSVRGPSLRLRRAWERRPLAAFDPLSSIPRPRPGENAAHRLTRTQSAPSLPPGPESLSRDRPASTRIEPGHHAAYLDRALR